MADSNEEEIILRVNIEVNGQDQLGEVGAQMDEVAQQVNDAVNVIDEQMSSLNHAFQLVNFVLTEMAGGLAQWNGGLSDETNFEALVHHLSAVRSEGEFVAGVLENLAIIMDGDVEGAERIVAENMLLVQQAFLDSGDASNTLFDRLLALAQGMGEVKVAEDAFDSGLQDQISILDTLDGAFEAVGVQLVKMADFLMPLSAEADALDISINDLNFDAFIEKLQASGTEGEYVAAVIEQVAIAMGGDLRGAVEVVAGNLGLVKDAFVGTADESVPLIEQLVRLADEVAQVGAGAGGTVPPINNLNAALGSGGEAFNQYTSGLQFIAKALNNTQANIQNTIDKQVEDITRSLQMAQAFLQVAEASNAEESALAALRATVDSLSGRLEIASQAQDVLRATFSASKDSLDTFGTALVSLGNSYAKLNNDIADEAATQAEQVHIALAASQALLQYAQDNGQSAETTAVLEQNVASLMEKLSFLREQVLASIDAWVTYKDNATASEEALSRLSQRLDTNANVLRQQVDDEIRANYAVASLTRTLLRNAEQAGNTGDAYNALTLKLNTLADEHTILVNMQQQLGHALDQSSVATIGLGKALLDVGDRYAALDANARESIDAQLKQATAARDATYTLKEYARASGYTVQVIDQLYEQYVTLSDKVGQLTQQQKLLNEVFGEQAPTALNAYDEALQMLAERLGNANLQTSKEMQAELESVQARLRTAQALWEQADAAGASQSALNKLQDTIDGLIDKEHVLQSAIRQTNELAAQTPAAPAAPAEEGGGGAGGGSEGLAQQNAFMMMMFAQRVMQVAQQFIALGSAADTALSSIQAQTGMTQQAVNGVATQLEQLATSSGFGLDKLAQGFNVVTQAGYNTNDSLIIMTASAKLARATSTDLATTTSTLSSVMDTFHMKGSEAAKTANLLMVGAQAAHQTVQNFATSLAQSAEDAQAAHVSLAEVAAAQAVLSVRFGNASSAASTLSTMLHSVSLDASTVSANVQKAGLSFDEAKFQTLDWAGKLEYLNTITHGNGREIQQLIGGSALLKQAMGGLGLSTHQLSINAVNLGLSFNAAHYNSLSLADKLQYLLQVSGGNEKTFQTLMGGAGNLNGAFQNLKLTTGDVARQAQHLGLTFNASRFQSESLVQKLQDLWAISGKNVGTFQTLVGGAKEADAALALIGVNGGGKYKQALDQMQGGTYKLDSAFSTAMGSMSAKTGQLVAMIQNMSYQFLEAIKPQLTAFLGQVSVWLGVLAQHMNIVMPVVAALAIALGVVLVAALAPLIAMLGAIVAASWPFIIAGAAIGAAAVLIYQNWSRIAPIFAPIMAIFHRMAPIFEIAWHAIQNVVKGLVADLGSLLIPAFKMLQMDLSVLSDSWNRFGSAIQPAIPILKIFGAILGGLVAVAISMTIGLISGLIVALGHFITGIVTIVAGIITIFMGLSQFFVGLWSFWIDLFTGNWGKLGADLQNMGKGILTIFEGLMTVLIGLVEAVLGTIVGFVVGFVTGVISFFVSLYNALVGHSIIPDMVNGILQWFNTLFSSAISGIAGWINSVISWFINLSSKAISVISGMVSSVLSFLSNLGSEGVARVQSMASSIIGVLSSLPGQAATWGADMISGFIGGIQSMAGGVISAVSGLASQVAGFLHFSKPDVGPLSTADEWMPHFGDLLSEGMLSNVGKLQHASRQLALAAGSGVSVPSTNGLSGASGGNSAAMATLLAQILATMQQQNSATNRVGFSATAAGLSAVTQQFGPMTFNGVGNITQLYRQFNILAGYAQEFANRGATSGLGI